MWLLVRRLRQSGVTIILTTHYIEEAEEIADRVGVINKGELLVVDDKAALMHKLGKRQLTIEFEASIERIPETLSGWDLELATNGDKLTYTYDPRNPNTGVAKLLREVADAGLLLKDVDTTQSSLEDIFIDLVNTK